MGFGVHGWAIIGVLRAIRHKWGKGTVTNLLEDCSSYSKEVMATNLHASSKYEGLLVTEILVELEKKEGDGKGAVVYKAGHGTGSLAVDVMFPVYKSITNEERFFTSLPRLWDRMMVDAGVVEVVPTGGDSILIKLVRYPSKEKVWSYFWAGWLVGSVENACGAKDVTLSIETISEPDSVTHEYRISWRSKNQ